MLKKLKVTFAIMLTNLILAGSALAEDYGGIKSQDAASLGEKITELVKSVGMPLGGGILFLSVIIIAIKLIITAANARKRVEVMEGLMYIGIGGALLGSALFIAGAILGIGEALSS